MILRSLREALVSMLAILATLVCALTLVPGTGPAVLAVVLCLSLSRSQLDGSARGRMEAAVALPVVGFAALGVGALLLRAPWLGAAFFVAGMFVSIWLRRFGPLGRRAGSLIALPFVALLSTPYVAPSAAGLAPVVMAPIVVALLALFWVSVLHMLARRLGILPLVSRVAKYAAPVRTENMPSQPVASTRMAIQMAVALMTAFAVGYIFFAERWTWIVLTAFIVLSGNRGRLDVAYKSVLRIAGAAAGTVAALLAGTHIGSHDTITIVLILAAVFLGVWLRPLGYAWWALFATLALALLQGFADASIALVLPLRLEEILIGAVIGVASAWFVLPVRSTAVLRRRIADALAILSDGLDPADAARSGEAFIIALHGVEQLAPAFRAGRIATRRWRMIQPADWVETLLACREPALALIAQRESPGAVRRAVGAARKALRDPAQILPTLRELREQLDAARRVATVG